MWNFLPKSKPPKTPADLVRHTRNLLNTSKQSGADALKSKQKFAESIGNLIQELKSILYGRNGCDPVQKDCAELTQEFFNGDTLRLLIDSFPRLNRETRAHSTHVVTCLLKQKLGSRMIACDYLESNLDLVDILIGGYDQSRIQEAEIDGSLHLHYGAMLRECIRHQSIAKYILESNPNKMKLFFYYIQVSDFEIAADATETFRQLLTRHKSTVAEFLWENYDWFFSDYNSKLLGSTNYITKRQGLKLLGEMLADRSNLKVMERFINSKENLRVFMILLKEPCKGIQKEAFNIFKLFVANPNKNPCIRNILVANKTKIIPFILSDLQALDQKKKDEQFEDDKAWVVTEIAALPSWDQTSCR